MNPYSSEPLYRVGDPAPPPLPARSEAEVMTRWQGDKPVVSIFCPTFQHVGFIEDALRGFLGQDTDFPFEILVRDDASTDGTAEIVRDYASRYPNIIRAVLETENRYPQVKALRVLRPMARGAFMATCEGDDYWIHPDKLQRQVARLTAHHEYVGSHHDVLVIQDSRVLKLSLLGSRAGKDISQHALMRGSHVPTSSLVYRDCRDYGLVRNNKVLAGDLFFQAQLGQFGGFACVAGPAMSVYRVHPGGVWSRLRPVEVSMEDAISSYWIGCHFAETGKKQVAAYWLGRSVSSIWFGLFKTYGVLPSFRPRVFARLLLALSSHRLYAFWQRLRT